MPDAPLLTQLTEISLCKLFFIKNIDAELATVHGCVRAMSTSSVYFSLVKLVKLFCFVLH